jgi:hypothetical protein
VADHGSQLTRHHLDVLHARYLPARLNWRCPVPSPKSRELSVRESLTLVRPRLLGKHGRQLTRRELGSWCLPRLLLVRPRQEAGGCPGSSPWTSMASISRRSLREHSRFIFKRDFL